MTGQKQGKSWHNSTLDLPEGYRLTELGPLPDEWRVVQLGEVVTLTMGQSPPSTTYNVNWQGLPFLQGKAEFGDIYPRPVKWCSKPIRIAKSDSVLISVRAPVGDVNIAQQDYCIGRGLASLSGKQDLDNMFMFYFLLNSKSRLEEEGTGSTFKSINKSTLSNFSIPLPPLPEQRAIAHALRAVQEGREATERVIAAARELKKSLMHHLFTYGPVPIDQADQVPLQETEIGPIPAHWRVVKLGEVITIHDKKRVPLSSTQRRKMRGPYPYCGANGILDYINEYLFDGEFVLLAEDGGYWGKLGPSAYIMRGKFWVNNHAHVIQAIRATTINEYLLNTFFYLDLDPYISGTTRGKLNQGVLKSISIPLPPLAEQQEIVRILHRVDEKIQAEERHKEALVALFKTLLHHLMTARVRVSRELLVRFEKKSEAMS